MPMRAKVDGSGTGSKVRTPEELSEKNPFHCVEDGEDPVEGKISKKSTAVTEAAGVKETSTLPGK